MDFAEGEETVTVPAVFDESGLQRGFDAGYPRQIDVALEDLFGNIYLRSEEHTSELQSLMRISYAVFCLKKKKQYTSQHTVIIHQYSMQTKYIIYNSKLI